MQIKGTMKNSAISPKRLQNQLKIRINCRIS